MRIYCFIFIPFHLILLFRNEILAVVPMSSHEWRKKEKKISAWAYFITHQEMRKKKENWKKFISSLLIFVSFCANLHNFFTYFFIHFFLFTFVLLGWRKFTFTRLSIMLICLWWFGFADEFDADFKGISISREFGDFFFRNFH